MFVSDTKEEEELINTPRSFSSQESLFSSGKSKSDYTFDDIMAPTKGYIRKQKKKRKRKIAMDQLDDSNENEIDSGQSGE